MKPSALSRADVLKALLASEAHGFAVPLHLLGYERLAMPDPQKTPRATDHGRDRPEPPAAEPADIAAPALPSFPKPKPDQKFLKFYVCSRFEPLEDIRLSELPKVPPISDAELAMPSPSVAAACPAPDLMPWPRLGPFLRRSIGTCVPGSRIDDRSLSRLIAKGLPLGRLPTLSRPHWGHAACILWDTSHEMEPYHSDAARLLARLQRERGEFGLSIVKCPSGAPKSLPTLPPHTPLIALSAMGQLRVDADLQHGWARLGLQLLRAGHPLTVLSPCPPRRCLSALSAQLAAIWPRALWDRFARLPRHRAHSTPVGATSGTIQHNEIVAGESPQHLHPLTETLLALLSPASYISPGLLRCARFALGSGADVGMESEAWLHPETTGSGSIRYFSFKPGAAYEARLAHLQMLVHDPETSHLAGKVGDMIREDHRRVGSLATVIEMLIRHSGADNDPTETLCVLERIVQRLRELAPQPGSREGLRSGLPAWFIRFVEERASPALRQQPAYGSLIAQGYALSRAFLEQLAAPWPEGIDPDAATEELRRIKTGTGITYTCAVHLSSVGIRLGAMPAESRVPFLGLLAYRQPFVHIRRRDHALITLALNDDHPASVALRPWEPFVIETDRQRMAFHAIERPMWADQMVNTPIGLRASVEIQGRSHQWEWQPALRDAEKGHWISFTKPDWAERIWADHFGLAADLRVGEVPFVFRWIPPGQFWMGSPEDEPGRRASEGPRHLVTISKDFWLMDAPVTQQQWRAVAELCNTLRKKAGEDLPPSPSHFKGPPDLPVDSVSWQDCRAFSQALNALALGLHSSLPTEAQWEWACRAGTQTALYSGPLEIRGERNGPALDAIAWYGGNSGQGLEVENPRDAKEWEGRQYPDQQAGTHRVRLKEPNPFGLYDMLGNVWEWCSDAWDPKAYERRKGDTIDPEETFEDKSAPRVIRGGSWFRLAENCRAAFRSGLVPGRRWDVLGFRLCAGQVEIQSGDGVAI